MFESSRRGLIQPYGRRQVLTRTRAFGIMAPSSGEGSLFVKIHPVWGLLVCLPLPSQAMPLKAALDTALVGGGTMLFVAGLIMLVIPRWFRTGVLMMLFADALFLSRILFLGKWQDWLTTEGWLPWIEGLSRDGARFYTLMGVVACLLCVWSVRRLLRQPAKVPPQAKRPAEPAAPEPAPATGHRRASASQRKLRMHDYPDR